LIFTPLRYGATFFATRACFRCRCCADAGSRRARYHTLPSILSRFDAIFRLHAAITPLIASFERFFAYATISPLPPLDTPPPPLPLMPLDAAMIALR